MSATTDRLFSRDIDKMRTSVFVTIKQAFLFLTPVFLIGACTLTVKYFPVEVVRTFVGTVWSGKLDEFLTIVYNVTYGFAAVYLVMTLSYLDALSEMVHNDVRIFSTISSTVCYFAFLGPEVLRGEVELIEYTKMGNIFSAMLIALACTRMFYRLYFLLAGKSGENYTTTFARGIRSIVPFFCCLSLAAIIAEIFSLWPEVYNFNDLMLVLLAKPFESIGANYLGGLLIMLFESILWMMGIHGSNVFDDLLTSQTGAFAFANGQIMNKAFLDTFVLMGGCGSAICLFLAIILFSKDNRKRKICKLAGAPLLFNINEILIFGIPIVFNLAYLVPFVLTPMINYTIAYVAILSGIVPQIVNAEIPWTTPVFISGFQATGSVAGSLLQLLLLCAGTAIYAPFVRFEDRILKENEEGYMNRLTDICKAAEAEGTTYRLENANTVLHAFEDTIYSKLSSDIANGEIGLHYQPQVCCGRIVSAEALLRFKLNDGRFIYPPLVVGIARNRGAFDAMSRAIVSRALRDLKEMQKQDAEFKIAVNLGLELLMNDSFRNWLIESVEKADVTPRSFGVEITEDAKISDAGIYQDIFDKIRKAGIEVSMDDFSMGHTSITILQKNYFDYVKIDGNLIRALENERIKSIVASITELGAQLNFQVVAECVETEKQRDELLNMGCRIFQGYLYYKDMPITDLEYILKKQQNCA